MKKIAFLLLLSTFSANAQTNTDITLTIQQPTPICNPSDCTTLFAEYTDVLQTLSYNIMSIPYEPYPYDFGTPISLQNDDSYASLNIPFNFNFYGNNYSQIAVGSNGVISFGTTETNCPWAFNTTIPNAGFPIKNAIYGVYQDTNLSLPNAATSVNYTITGVSPNRKFILNFKDCAQYQCNLSAGLQTSQIVLHETTNIIDVNVLRRVACSTWQNGNGLIGIQNATGTIASYPPGRNTGNWSAFNESWRFLPNESSVPTEFLWMLDGVALSSENPLLLCGNNLDENSQITANVTYNPLGGQSITLTESIISPIASQPALSFPIDLIVCNEFDTVDLTINQQTILNGLNPGDFDIYFFQTQIDAMNFANPIANPTNYVYNNGEVIYCGIDVLETGCIYTRVFQIIQSLPVEPPIGITPQNFIPGQTLADLIVDGTNILWYDAPIGGNLLPNTTLLQNGVTYYASQTNQLGCESKNINSVRLAITTEQTLNSFLFSSENFTVSPNPTKELVNINTNFIIDSLDIYNQLGQKIKSIEINQKNTTLNLASYSKGIYFIKIFTQNSSKIVKVVKD